MNTLILSISDDLSKYSIKSQRFVAKTRTEYTSLMVALSQKAKDENKYIVVINLNTTETEIFYPISLKNRKFSSFTNIGKNLSVEPIGQLFYLFMEQILGESSLQRMAERFIYNDQYLLYDLSGRSSRPIKVSVRHFILNFDLTDSDDDSEISLNEFLQESNSGDTFNCGSYKIEKI